MQVPLVWHLHAHLLHALIITFTYMQSQINAVFLNTEKYYVCLITERTYKGGLRCSACQSQIPTGADGRIRLFKKERTWI